jgi:hypothetical protein
MNTVHYTTYIAIYQKPVWCGLLIENLRIFLLQILFTIYLVQIANKVFSCAIVSKN